MPFDGTEYVDPVREVLRQGRARVAQGWCQDSEVLSRPWWKPWGPKLRYCAWGAIDQDETALVPLLHALGIPFGDWADLAEWNDDPERTQADVIAAFDDALE